MVSLKLHDFIMDFIMESFGDDAPRPRCGLGVERARERLHAHQKAQAERLLNAAGPVMTRQQRRYLARRRKEA
jgi:hypothetical protein